MSSRSEIHSIEADFLRIVELGLEIRQRNLNCQCGPPSGIKSSLNRVQAIQRTCRNCRRAMRFQIARGLVERPSNFVERIALRLGGLD